MNHAATFSAGLMARDPFWPLDFLVALLLVGLWMRDKVVFWGLARWTNYRTKIRLHALAQRLGFQIEASTKAGGFYVPAMQVTGTHRGRPVRIFARQNYGKYGLLWASVTVDCKLPADTTLHVVPNKRLLRMAWRLAPRGGWWIRASFGQGEDINWRGLQDLRTGDENFDQAFFVKTNNPAWARTMLTPKVREVLLAARQERETLTGIQLRHKWLVSLRWDADEVRYSVGVAPFYWARKLDHLVAQMDFVCDQAAAAEAPARRGQTFISNTV